VGLHRRNLIRGLTGIVALVLVSCTAHKNEEAIPVANHVDPAATRILARMTGYLGGLKQFSVSTQITLEDELASGHIADTDISTHVTVQRPNKIRATRRGDVIDQDFYYDGRTLTLHNSADRVYATVPAPKTVEGTIDYAREKLGLNVPASDIIYRNAYPLLMEDVTHAALVGKAVIEGVKCDHLLFTRPGVDFQVWVADSGAPLPHKYVVTDTGTPERLRITTVMSDWDVNPVVAEKLFEFRAPEGAQAIAFLPLVTTGGSDH
jgi:hypothetical protein